MSKISCPESDTFGLEYTEKPIAHRKSAGQVVDYLFIV
jgi:hypothetical protein